MLWVVTMIKYRPWKQLLRNFWISVMEDSKELETQGSFIHHPAVCLHGYEQHCWAPSAFVHVEIGGFVMLVLVLDIVGRWWFLLVTKKLLLVTCFCVFLPSCYLVSYSCCLLLRGFCLSRYLIVCYWLLLKVAYCCYPFLLPGIILLPGCSLFTPTNCLR